MNRSQNKLIAVVGPTGSGKTALAVELAQKFNGVLISADSRQVYCGLDIGTNKEKTDIDQHLIDIAKPCQRFTLNDWLTSARALLPKIWAAGQIPIIVGGTGLYVTALLEGYQPGGGRFATRNKPVNFRSLILQLDIDRTVLNERSDQRYERIFDTLLMETQSLIEHGVSADWLDRIGLDYRYAFKRITGVLSRDEAISQYQRASRQYIRRQLTWWRHHGAPFLIKTKTQAEIKVREFLTG